MSDRQVPFAWARLNADTLFVALLAIGSGLFAMIDPYADPVLADRRVVVDTVQTYPLLFVAAGSYLCGGLVLLAALARASVPLEVVARSVLIGGALLHVYRSAYQISWTDLNTVQTYVVLALIVLTTVLRLSVLLGNKAVIISRPRKEEDQS